VTQSNGRIIGKHKQTFNAFFMPIYCFIHDFVAQADSIKTVAVPT